jgi:hypothetical protein
MAMAMPLVHAETTASGIAKYPGIWDLVLPAPVHADRADLVRLLGPQLISFVVSTVRP